MNMYEHKHQPLAELSTFILRLAGSFLAAILLIIIALTIGMSGYHYFEGLPWIDSFLDASMILSGMGPVSTLSSVSGKLFAGFYALFSGLVFITIMGLILAPILHRFMHQFYHDKPTK